MNMQKAKRKAEVVEELPNGTAEQPVKKKKKKEKAAAAAAEPNGEVLAAASTEQEGKKKVSSFSFATSNPSNAAFVSCNHQKSCSEVLQDMVATFMHIDKWL